MATNVVFERSEDLHVRANILYANTEEMQQVSGGGDAYLYYDEECTQKAYQSDVVNWFNKGTLLISVVTATEDDSDEGGDDK